MHRETYDSIWKTKVNLEISTHEIIIIIEAKKKKKTFV